MKVGGNFIQVLVVINKPTEKIKIVFDFFLVFKCRE